MVPTQKIYKQNFIVIDEVPNVNITIQYAPILAAGKRLTGNCASVRKANWLRMPCPFIWQAE